MSTSSRSYLTSDWTVSQGVSSGLKVNNGMHSSLSRPNILINKRPDKPDFLYQSSNKFRRRTAVNLESPETTKRKRNHNMLKESVRVSTYQSMALNV